MMTKLVIRKQWMRGDDFNTYQMFIFEGDINTVTKLVATVDECVDVVRKVTDLNMRFTSENTDKPEGIISIMTWQY